MNPDNANLADDFVRRFDAMRDMGIEISGVIADVLTIILGETPAFAVMYIVGKRRLMQPRAFADRLTEVFGFSSRIVFEELIAESERYAPYVTVRP